MWTEATTPIWFIVSQFQPTLAFTVKSLLIYCDNTFGIHLMSINIMTNLIRLWNEAMIVIGVIGVLCSIADIKKLKVFCSLNS